MSSMCDSKNKSKCRSRNTQRALSLHLVTLIPRRLPGGGLECVLSAPSENPFLVSSPGLPEPDPRARSLWGCTKVSATSKAGPESDRSCASVPLWVLSQIRPDHLWAREGGYWSSCLPLPTPSVASVCGSPLAIALTDHLQGQMASNYGLVCRDASPGGCCRVPGLLCP